MNSTKKLFLGMVLALVFGITGCTKKKEIWIYTSLYKEVIAEMTPMLEKAVPGVKIQWYQGGSENIASKVSAELSAGKAKADLILTSDPFWYEELKEAGKLLTYESPLAKNVQKDFSDPTHAYMAVRLPVMVIGYNSDAIKPADLPKTWKDLALTKYKNKLAMPSPMESGTAFMTAALLSKKYGWDIFKDLRKNEILAAGGNSSVINRLETKEKVIGIVLLENILKAWGKGSPVRPIYPEDGAIPISSPTAIMKDTDNPEDAKKVYDWFFTDEAQKSIIKCGMYSLLPGMPSPENALPYEQMRAKMMPWSESVLLSLFKSRDEIKSHFNETVMK